MREIFANILVYSPALASIASWFQSTTENKNMVYYSRAYVAWCEVEFEI